MHFSSVVLLAPLSLIAFTDMASRIESCDLTTMLCKAPPSKGVPNGFGCGSNDVCQSGSSSFVLHHISMFLTMCESRFRRTGYCSGDFVCALAASAGSKKAKRAQCPADQLACSVGDGYEVSFLSSSSRTNDAAHPLLALV